MHRGVLFEVFACVGLIVAVVTWAMLSPLLVTSAETRLRNPTTGEIVICHASFANNFIPGHDPSEAVAVCQRSCENAGLQWIEGQALIIACINFARERRAQ